MADRVSTWAALSASARARLAPTLPAPCGTCGRLVYPWQDWDVGHVLPRATHPWLAGDPANQRVEHSACNRAAGARMTNRRRRGGRTFGWRG